MTSTAEHPLTSELDRPAGESRDEGPVTQTGAALFPELVWAHHRWERQRRRGQEADTALDKAYRTKLVEFQAAHGRLEHIYWSRRNASAVAMTVKPAKRSRWDRLRLRERDDVVRLHRLSDWITGEAPQVADLLHECDMLANRVGEVLRGTSELIAMSWIFGIEEHLMGFFERAGSLPDPDAEAQLVRTQRRELADAEAYYHRAASKAGRIVYVSGMLIGLCLLVPLAILAWSLLLAARMDGGELEILLLCFGSGAIGALVSAITRMGKPERGTFNLDFELGRPLMRRLGVYRPFVGAVFGVALYFLLASEILDITVTASNEPYYYGFAAFLSGFSERFANVMFGSAEKRLSGGGEEEDGERRKDPCDKGG
jgi:hypothetical protein